MTIVEFTGEVKELAKEGWWNGAGVVVVAFLVLTFILTSAHNDYLLYAALVFFLVHSYISTMTFGRKVQYRRHRRDITVAYRESLMQAKTLDDDQENHDRPHAGRNGRTPHHVPRLAALAGPPIAG